MAQGTSGSRAEDAAERVARQRQCRRLDIARSPDLDGDTCVLGGEVVDDLARLRRQALTIIVDECPDRHPASPVMNGAAEVFPCHF